MIRRIAALLCALCIFLSLPVLPARALKSPAREPVRQILGYYRYYQEAGWGDIQRLLGELDEIDPVEAWRWRAIMESWRSISREENIHAGVLPEGLPQDDSLCIVVMGFKLAQDGSIRPELQNRLETALESAAKYPNAFLLCTGGATASGRSDVTEAGQMEQWLLSAGVAENRIITETGAATTPQNAILAYELLQRDYPQVRSIALVTSDYHIYRSMLMFSAQAALTEAPYEILAGAVCETEKAGEREWEKQVRDLAGLVGIDLSEVTRQERLIPETVPTIPAEETVPETETTEPPETEILTEATAEETQIPKTTQPPAAEPEEREVPLFAAAAFGGALLLAFVLLILLLRLIKPKRTR